MTTGHIWKDICLDKGRAWLTHRRVYSRKTQSTYLVGVQILEYGSKTYFNLILIWFKNKNKQTIKKQMTGTLDKSSHFTGMSSSQYEII